jgi:hypothetical protein
MKIRYGFVTNSSSTSYIIGIKGGIDSLEEGLLRNVVKAIFNSKYNETSPAHEVDMEVEAKEQDPNGAYFKKVKAAYDNGFTIYRKWVGYDDSIGDVLSKIDDGKTFILLDHSS